MKTYTFLYVVLHWFRLSHIQDQDLSKNHFDSCVEFCEIIMNIIDDDSLLLNNIFFAQIRQFFNWLVTPHFGYWTDTNPQWIQEKLLNGIFNSQKVGVFFTEGDLNVQKYKIMPREVRVQAIPSLTNNQKVEI